jgi:hypothetical protein
MTREMAFRFNFKRKVSRNKPVIPNQNPPKRNTRGRILSFHVDTEKAQETRYGATTPINMNGKKLMSPSPTPLTPFDASKCDLLTPTIYTLNEKLDF